MVLCLRPGYLLPLVTTLLEISHSDNYMNYALICEFPTFLYPSTSCTQAPNYAGLVVYEYFVTFDQEVTQVWMRKPTATSFLLLSTRWIMLVFEIVSALHPSHAGVRDYLL